MADLDEFTARVLDLVCESAPIGAIRLAAYVWPDRVPGAWQYVLGDAIRDLNERGLVVYREGSYLAEEFDYRTTVNTAILAIRPTADGFRAAGYPTRLPLVGAWHSTPVIKPDPAKRFDGTRVYFHGLSAVGVGPIEREPLEVHRIHYPTHRHDTDFDVQNGRLVMGAANITDEQVLDIRRLRAGGMEIAEVATRLGISPGAVATHSPGRRHPRADEVLALMATGTKQKDVVKATSLPADLVSRIIGRAHDDELVARNPDALLPIHVPGGNPPIPKNPPAGSLPSDAWPTNGPTVMVPIPIEQATQLPAELDPLVVAGTIQHDSLRTAILKAIALDGPIADSNVVKEMVRNGRSINGHEVNHIIQSLQRQGFVKFLERRVGSRHQLTRIDITAAGLREAGVLRPTLTPSVRPGDSMAPANHGTHAVGGPVTRTKVLDVHDHDTGVWVIRCAACKIYHDDGETHAAAEARKAGREALATFGRTFEAMGRTATETPEIVVSGSDAPGPEPTDGFPLLDALRARVSARAKAAKSAQRYLEAAALLDGLDPAMQQKLMNLASSTEGEPFSALEIEYLRFADR